jgi:DNA polymerase-3 subunit delta'
MKIPFPKESAQLVGHEGLKNELLEMIRQQRLPHGILLAGAKGIGKATLAYHLARYLLQGGEGDFILDPGSSVFRQVMVGSHPDIITVTQDKDDDEDWHKEIPAEKARALVHFFQQKPMLGKWRVAIIDSIDELNHKGANSLLKILEEPPAHCLLILITHNIAKVLPTIRSRCQLFLCNHLTDEEIKTVLDTLHLDVWSEEQAFIAAVSEGRLGYGLSILKIGGQKFYQAMLSVFMDLTRGDWRSLIPFIEKYILNHAELGKEEAWQLGVHILQHWVATRLSKVMAQETTWVDSQEAKVAHAFFQSRPFNSFAHSWGVVNELLQQTRTFNLDKKQTLVCFFSRLSGLME